MVVEIFMNGKGHSVTDAEYCSKRIGPGPQVGNLAQELQPVPLLLQRIGFRIGSSINFDFPGLNLNTLSLSHRFRQDSRHGDATSGGDEF